jgi:hypothetical protein
VELRNSGVCDLNLSRNTWRRLGIGRDLFDLDGAHTAMNRAIAPSFSTGMPIAKAGIDLRCTTSPDVCGGRACLSGGRKPLPRITLSWTVNPAAIGETEKLVEEAAPEVTETSTLRLARPKVRSRVVPAGTELAPEAFLWADANGG